MAARPAKPDIACVAAVDLARAAALETAGVMGVGDHVGYEVEGDRVVTHFFACPHPGYAGWRWSVTVARASRAKVVTVDEVVLLPSDEALRLPTWVPWVERLRPGDVTPGMVMPTPDDDPRLEPGYTGGEQAASMEPAEASMLRIVVAELGLGRERVLSRYGREEAAARWRAGPGGPDNPSAQLAPGPCATCGYFARLQGSLGLEFGACTNEYSPADGAIVTMDHGCGAHSDVVADQGAVELPAPVWDTITVDDSLFD